MQSVLRLLGGLLIGGLVFVVVLVFAAFVSARPPRGVAYTRTAASATVTTQTFTTTQTTESVGEAVEALAEVNARRARSGLRPFLPDPLLTEGAKRCAVERARRGLFGHLPSDFAYLPPGAVARAGGCAAYPPGMGWHSCCVEENATYAGAAWAMGRDGKRYMHLFVR